MIQNSNERANTLEWREQNLKLTKWCLEKYQTTNDKEWLDWAKVFGEWSAKIKKNYL